MTASYEDYVAVSAARKVKASDWTEIDAHWSRTMGANMMQYAGHHDALAREEARLRAGGEPRAIEVKHVAGQVPAAPAQMPPANPVAAAMADPVYRRRDGGRVGRRHA